MRRVAPSVIAREQLQRLLGDSVDHERNIVFAGLPRQRASQLTRRRTPARQRPEPPTASRRVCQSQLGVVALHRLSHLGRLPRGQHRRPTPGPKGSAVGRRSVAPRAADRHRATRRGTHRPRRYRTETPQPHCSSAPEPSRRTPRPSTASSAYAAARNWPAGSPTARPTDPTPGSAPTCVERGPAVF